MLEQMNNEKVASNPQKSEPVNNIAPAKERKALLKEL
jgi:hypothetical protein